MEKAYEPTDTKYKVFNEKENEFRIKALNKFNYFEKREILISYLKMKTDECDWHGVSDCANDLRVLEAENR